QVVCCREIEVHLPRKLRLEVADLQVDDHEAPQAQVVEKEVEVEVVAVGFEVILSAHEGEAGAEFDQEVPDSSEKAPLQVALPRLGSQAQEVERVGVLQKLLRQVRLWCRQRSLEVGECLPLPAVEIRLDLVHEHVAAPAVLQRAPSVP